MRLKLIELRVFFFDFDVLVGCWMYLKKVLLVLVYFRLRYEIIIFKFKYLFRISFIVSLLFLIYFIMVLNLGFIN